MFSTFANLPEEINIAISNLLSEDPSGEWLNKAVNLHDRYVKRQKTDSLNYINSYGDALAYLSLRAPATYAQIYGALNQVLFLMPSWKPKTVLDIGCGPGTGVWAAKKIWPGLQEATCLDREKDFLSIGEKILNLSASEVKVNWENKNALSDYKEKENEYDLILVANLLNEMSPSVKNKFIENLSENKHSLIVFIEPGTQYGVDIIQKTAETFSAKGFKLLAPFVSNAYVATSDYWIHFSQRFIRPGFQRRLRQYMRESRLMASDWEEAKYAYVAISKIIPENENWGRVIGQVNKYKGYLEVPILTKEGIVKIKILKRHKKEYLYAKNLKWGQIIKNSKELVY